jgi:hypothetical protein
MKVHNELQKLNFFQVSLLTALLALGGCSSNAKYQAALSNAQSIADNSRIVPSSVDIAWNSVLDLAAQQGYIVTQKDAKGKILSMTKTTPHQEDPDISDTVKPTITFVAIAEQQTRVFLSATQTTEEDNEVTARDTVRNPEFYKDFFAKLAVKVTQKNKEAAVAQAAALKKAKADAAAKDAADEKAADAEVAAMAAQVVAKAEARKAAEAEAKRVAEEEQKERARIAAEKAKQASAKRHKSHHKSQKG